MNRARKLLSSTAAFLELPADVLAGIPKMELIGFQEFSIEPHKGLLEYEKEHISIETQIGRIHLIGKELTIRLMNSSRITIGGWICTLQLQEEHR